jgi:photosystem II stability/assembly factor-like uncharacterized protein
VIGGERIYPDPQGVVLGSSDGGSTFHVLSSFPDVVHIHALVKDGRRIWIGGDKTVVRSFLAYSSNGGKEWARVRTPSRLEDINGILSCGSNVLIMGRMPQGAAIFRSGLTGWRRLLFVKRRGRSAFLWRMSARGDRFVAVGTDGRQALLATSTKCGRFHRKRVPFKLYELIGTAFRTSVMISGVGDSHPPGLPREAGMTPMFLDWHWPARAWQKRSVLKTRPAKFLDVRFGARSEGVLLGATSRGSWLGVTSDGGASWRPSILRDAQGPLLFERFLSGPSRLVIGASGLYRYGGAHAKR